MNPAEQVTELKIYTEFWLPFFPIRDRSGFDTQFSFCAAYFVASWALLTPRLLVNRSSHLAFLHLISLMAMSHSKWKNI
jgi:hypothetical protein